MPDPCVRLTVNAADALTEVYLIDHQLLLRDSGLGVLDVELPPGLYKIKWRVGYELRERLVHLDTDGSPHRVELEVLPILSAAPLVGSTDFRDDHADAAAAASGDIHRRAGSGAGLSFFSRQVPASSTSANHPESEPIATTCSAILLSPSGERVAELTRDGVSRSTWCACTLELEPGIYRLRMDDGSSRSTDMTVPVPAGWQSQLFFLRRTCKHEGVTWKDLALFLSPDAAFDPGSSALLQTERLRWAFGQRRRLASEHAFELLDRCSWKEQPLQALFLAHLILLSGNTARQHLPGLIQTLRDLLPDGDVVPLELEAGLDTSAPVSTAPLLRRSWELLVRHSAERPSLIPADLELARLAGRIVNSEPWLAWVQDVDADQLVRRAIERQLLLVDESPFTTDSFAPQSDHVEEPERVSDEPFTFSGSSDTFTTIASQFGSTLAEWGRSLASFAFPKPGGKAHHPSPTRAFRPDADRLRSLAASDSVVHELVQLLGLRCQRPPKRAHAIQHRRRRTLQSPIRDQAMTHPGPRTAPSRHTLIYNPQEFAQ